MKISIIGTGNLAWHLCKVFEKNDFDIQEIYGREIAKAIDLSQELYQTSPVDSLDFSESAARLFFLCVSDDAIEEICSKILLPENSTLIHCSGSKPLEILSKTLEIYHDLDVNVGVFYPVMTFTKGKSLDFVTIPVCLEAENESTMKLLMKIARIISDSVYVLNSFERSVLHISAVFACNFTNHLWALSKEILNSEDLNFDLLKPLIIETTNKALDSAHPSEVQTGPAMRNDKNTMGKHLEFLSDDPDLLNVYKVLSNSILDWHQKQ
jgi:predicted short-subunit dehydrogenase-like oxidoreductase (DUF2520 family)